MMLSANEIAANLASCCGSDVKYVRKAGAIRVEYTEGIKCLQEIAECYWLIDAIASYQTRDFKALSYFQSWCLDVNLETKSAILTCDDGNNNSIASQEIEYTSFALPQIKIWADVSNVVFLMLPSEY